MLLDCTPRPGFWRWPAGASVACLLVASGLLLGGCSNLEDRVDEAAAGEPSERRESLEEFAGWLRHHRLGDPEAAADRTVFDEFLRQRFDPIVEPDGVARSQLLSLALQGEMPCTAELLVRGTQDQHALVRLVAVQGFRDVQPPDARSLLTNLLAHDSELQVRIEAAKTMARIGDAGWARPLANLVVDPAEEPDLRHQAHRAANHLLGTGFPFVPSVWRDWLQKNP